MVFLPNPPEADKSLRYAQKIILEISTICLRLFFSHVLILNKNPHLWMDAYQIPASFCVRAKTMGEPQFSRCYALK
jgi:hypothetical protein